MSNEDRALGRTVRLLSLLVLLSLILGGINLYLGLVPSAGGKAPEPVVPEAAPPAVRSEARAWADAGDALAALAGGGKGEVKALETAAWCYDRSLGIEDDPDVKARAVKIEQRMLGAEAEKAENDGAWDRAFDLYSRLHEKNPSPALQRKVEEARARRATLYYTYAGKAEEAMKKRNFEEAVKLYENALSCMDQEEGRRSLLIARVERQKEAGGSTAKSPSLAHMNYKAVTEFFRDNAGSKIRVTGGLGVQEGPPAVRVLGDNTYVVIRIPNESRPVTVTGVFNGASFADNLLDYDRGNEVEIVGAVVPGSSNYSYTIQASSIQKMGQPETFACVESGRIVPIPDAVKSQRSGDYGMMFRNPGAFKGKSLKWYGRIVTIVFDKGSTAVTVASVPEGSSRSYYGSYQNLPFTEIRFAGEDSFDWFLDYEQGNAVEFEAEIEGEKKREEGSSYSEVYYALSSNRLVVTAKGVSMNRKDMPETLVKADGGREKPVANPGEYLARCDIVARAPARFKGRDAAFRIQMRSIRTMGDVTVMQGYAARKVEIGDNSTTTQNTNIACCFPGGDFIDNFMDYVPGQEVEIAGKVSEQWKEEGGRSRYYDYSHGSASIFLQGSSAKKTGDPKSAVHAQNGRTHPIENAESLRKHHYVIDRNVTKYAGAVVTWKGRVYDVETHLGSVTVQVSDVDPVGDYEGRAMLYFRDLSCRKKLEAMDGKDVTFTGKIMPPGERSDSVVLEAASIELTGNQDSRIEVTAGSGPPGPAGGQ